MIMGSPEIVYYTFKKSRMSFTSGFKYTLNESKSKYLVIIFGWDQHVWDNFLNKKINKTLNLLNLFHRL